MVLEANKFGLIGGLSGQETEQKRPLNKIKTMIVS